MGGRITLDYGRRLYHAKLPAGSRVLRAPTPCVPPAPLGEILERAMAAPIASAPLAELARGAKRVTVIVSDPTRKEPREAMLQAVLDQLPDGAEVTLAVATGTHGPCDLDALEISRGTWGRVAQVINHDGHNPRALVELGRTRRSTPVVVHPCLVDCDLVVATGAIIPHYFAGFGAGVKALFPGLGGAGAVRINHRLKQEPGARAGITDGNPCRDDLEEAVGMLAAPSFLVNAIVDDDGAVRDAVCGNLVQAFRNGAERCAPLYRVRAAPSSAIVVSGRPPTTSSLYQASKLVAAVAGLLLPGGTIVLAAECELGVGPVDVVNRGIYEIGLKPRLPDNHRVVLVSSLSEREVAATYCQYAPSVEAALIGLPPPLVCPRAGSLLVESESPSPPVRS